MTVSKSTPNKSNSHSEEHDIVFLCSSSAESQDVAQAVHALYYLPNNYKLVMLDGDDKDTHHAMPWAEESIKNRIQFSDKINNKEELSKSNQATPFSIADFIVSDEKSKNIFNACSAPQVRIDTTISQVSEEKNGFRVPIGNPEALASAIMRLAAA